MLFIEVFFRFGSIGLLIAIGLLVLRDARNIPALRFALPLILSMICLFMATGSEGLVISGPYSIILRLCDMMVFVFAWWFGLALFDDDFTLGAKEWSVAIFFACILAPMRLSHHGFDIPWSASYDNIISGLTLLLLGHLAYRAVLGRREDLVENRRRVRVLFAAAIVLVAATSVVTEVAMESIGGDSSLSLFITYVITFFLCVWALLWLTKLHPELFAFHDKNNASNNAKIEAQDAVAHTRLVETMEKERVYNRHGLTIGDLAQIVGIPPHQLRTLINRSMGYRNFSTFLNHYRLQDVKKALADPENSRIPVLTIALDAGFSSLAPFNRAFKSSIGVTPTEYRNQSLSEN